MLRLFLTLLAFCAAVLSPVEQAQAQAGPSTAYSGLSVINQIIRNTPGIGAVSVGGSTTLSAAGTVVTRTAGGMVIPIAETAAVAVGAARLGGMAASAMKLGSVIGIATIVAPWILQQSGYVVCPPPDFFCHPGPPLPSTPVGKTGYYGQGAVIPYSGTGQGVCDQVYSSLSQADRTKFGTLNYISSKSNPGWVGYCQSVVVTADYQQSYVGYTPITCPSGVTSVPQPDGTATCSTPGPNVPSTQTELATIIQNKAAGDATSQQSLYNAVSSAGVGGVLTGTEPVTVTAPAVTTQPVTQTQTISNPDGTTSTQTITKTTTVSPVISPGSVNTTTISYPAHTDITTTTTNNTTNVTTSSTTTINENAVPDTAPTKDLPDDYAREGTLKSIEADLSTQGAPILPDQNARVTAAAGDSDSKMQTMRDQTLANKESDESLFYKFIWNPPAGTCQPYTVGFRSFTGTVDICDTVALLRDILGWLMALGSALSVYNALFKNSDE